MWLPSPGRTRRSAPTHQGLDRCRPPHENTSRRGERRGWMKGRTFWIAAVLGALLLTPGCGGDFDDSVAGAPSSDPTRQAERERMVERQIEARGVKDTAVLRVMRQVPRHLFVPVSYAPQAYWDGPPAIGHGQMISQPYIVAFTAEAPRMRRDDRVLEIGNGSGYQTAVLAQLARH